MIVGYTTGVFDMFHVGHLNILKNTKKHCDYLIVGVSTDKLVKEHKEVQLITPFTERCEIVSSIKYVDQVVQQDSYDKIKAWQAYNFHKMFVGSDWKGTERWNKLEVEFQTRGVEIIYIPYTRNISSTHLRKFIEDNYSRHRHP
jgi:glycerol-3-phosphate cytidylyltransferase